MYHIIITIIITIIIIIIIIITIINLSRRPLVPGHDHHRLGGRVLVVLDHLLLDLLDHFPDLRPLGVFLEQALFVTRLALLLAVLHVTEDPVPGGQEERLRGVEEDPSSGLHGALRGLEGGNKGVEGDAVVLGEVGEDEAEGLEVAHHLSRLG